MKILVIEDEQDLATSIQKALHKQSYLIEHAPDYGTAEEKIALYNYDCILLDITLPDGSGLDILRKLKKAEKSGNVIIISAKNALDDKLEGLELGADDYLTKPFHLSELNARVKAVLRRNTFKGSEILEAGNSLVDVNNRIFKIAHVPCELNRKEFDILLYFMVNKNRLITKSALAEHVWGDFIDQADNFDFVYYQIKNLRKKLKDYRLDININSIYGVGYKLEVE